MKAILAVSLILLLHTASAGVVEKLTSEDSRELEVPDSVCKVQAHFDALSCTRHGNKSDEQFKCLSDVVFKYIHCKEPVAGELDLSSEDEVLTSIASKAYGHISMENIRCIVDNVLDLIKCVVDGELKDEVPLIWDWTALAKCVFKNIPTYAECLPSQ